MLYSHSISAREMQRDYKDVFKKANEEQRPIVVFAHNKPLGAVIGVNLLEKIQMELIVAKTLKEHEEGKTTFIDDFEAFEKEVREAAK